ncbi:MAG: response regulator [Chthoniobacterales bacterium]
MKERPGDSAANKRKVLVIDDSVMLLSFVKEILGEANYDVTTAATGEEGISAAGRERPDLILLDYVLPDMQGDKASERLRASDTTARIPVVYMAGFGTELRAEEITGNVIGSLNKPFTSDLLTRKVAEQMRVRPPEAAAKAEPNAAEPGRPGEAAKPTSEAARIETVLERPPIARSDSAEGVGDPMEIKSEPVQSMSGAAEAVGEPIETANQGMERADEPADTKNEAVESVSQPSEMEAGAGATAEPWWSTPVTPSSWPESPATVETAAEAPVTEAPAAETNETFGTSAPDFHVEAEQSAGITPAAPLPSQPPEPLPASGNTFFAGASSFFSLHRALQTIGKEKLTGVLRCFWDKEPVELLARDGGIVLVTTRDPQLYCPEAPITLVNVDAGQTDAARAEQRETGCPLFLALTRQDLIPRDTATQLMQHYGQKLFAQLWSGGRVRFIFELTPGLPPYANDVPGDDEVDQWALGTLRFIQFHELSETAETEPNLIPAYTRDGYERVQQLRLTVAEAQFASQFNGVRSTAQIAKNLRLDIKFARLTLFRFIALGIVECWPPTPQAKQERRGFFQRIGGTIGLGD